MNPPISRRTILTASMAAFVAGKTWHGKPTDGWAEAVDKNGHERAASFADSLERNPRWRIFRGLDKDQPQAIRLKTKGQWPTALKGRFLRAVPAGLQRFDARVNHWFDGDGLIEEFRIEDGQVYFRSRFVATAKRRRETQAGRWLYSGFGTDVADPMAIRSPDDINVANTSLLYHAGELMVLWEGGSPTLLSQDHLARTGFKIWRDDARGIPFTAHPRQEADGRLWAFGYDVLGKRIFVMEITANGKLRRIEAVPVDPLGMVHDFVTTQKHLVFLIPPWVCNTEIFRSGRKSFLDSHHWKPELGTRVLIVAKNDFRDQRWVDLPPRFVFHYGNGWEESDGTIRLDAWTYPDPTIVTQTTRLIMHGVFFNPAEAQAKLALIRITPSGESSELGEQNNITGEFPKIDPRLVGHRNNYLLYLAPHRSESPPGEGEVGWFQTLVMRYLENGQEHRFEFNQHVALEEHVMIPRQDKPHEKDCWVLGTARDPLTQETQLSLFESSSLDQGPIAEAVMSGSLTYGLHAVFIAG